MINALRKNKYLLSKISSTTYNKLRDFRNKHEGESCYIFGNGPSIKWFDLSQFGDKPAISSGQLHYHQEFNALDIKYLCLVEPWFFTGPIFRRPFISQKQSQILNDHKEIKEDYISLIENSAEKTFFINISNFFHVRATNVKYVYKTLPHEFLPEQIRHFDLFSGSFFATLSLAYFLGFKNVHMIGFDAWTLTPSLNNRYYEFGPGLPSKQMATEEPLLDIFKNLMNISVISHNSSSKVLNYIDYEEFFKVKAIYRENHEIIKESYLSMMNSCPGYKIYDLS